MALLYEGVVFGVFTLLLTQNITYAMHVITVPRDSEDATLNPLQMIARNGYPAEAHLVTTEDGYILTLHRIPPFKSGEGAGHPVLLQHGLLASSADWLISGPGQGLAYVLADLGYDVWLGNARGNTHSRAHRNLSASDAKFWDFSFHEMGYYDIPAVTEFIVTSTNHPQLTYVGHSMGTTMFWVFCTTRPQLQHRVRQMHALAPIAFMSRMHSPLRNLAPFARELQITLALIGEHEFLPHGEVKSYLVEEFLRINHIGAKGAEYVFFSICGFDPKEFNQTLLPSILGHTPAGASTQSVLHYLQEVKSGKFRQYDEGTSAGNERRYGTPEPPEYDLSKLEVPVAMQYSLNDWLANTDDVKQLFAKLKNPIGLFEVPLKTFNHLDYLWAKDARQLVYTRVLELMRNSSEQIQARLTREKLAEDYVTLKKHAGPLSEVMLAQLKERQAQFVTTYGGLMQRLSPSYNYLFKQLQQLNDQELSKDLARRWGPGVVSRLEQLQSRLQAAAEKPQQQASDSEAAVTSSMGWYDSVKNQVKTYPSLLAVKSTPLVSRMLSTLQSQIEITPPPEAPVTSKVQETPSDVTSCQCSGIPSYACKHSNRQNLSNEV